MFSIRGFNFSYKMGPKFQTWWKSGHYFYKITNDLFKTMFNSAFKTNITLHIERLFLSIHIICLPLHQQLCHLSFLTDTFDHNQAKQVKKETLTKDPIM